MPNKALNIFQFQAVDGLLNQGGHVRLDALCNLLQPQRLECLLNFGETTLHAVEVGAGRNVEDVPDA